MPDVLPFAPSSMGQVPFKPESKSRPPQGAYQTAEDYYGGPSGPGGLGVGAVGGGSPGVGAFDQSGRSPVTHAAEPQMPTDEQPQQPQPKKLGIVRRSATWAVQTVPWWGWALVVGGGLYAVYRTGQGKHPVPFMRKKRKNGGKTARVVIDAVTEED
jgi:hypothetical protein